MVPSSEGGLTSLQGLLLLLLQPLPEALKMNLCAIWMALTLLLKLLRDGTGLLSINASAVRSGSTLSLPEGLRLGFWITGKHFMVQNGAEGRSKASKQRKEGKASKKMGSDGDGDDCGNDGKVSKQQMRLQAIYFTSDRSRQALPLFRSRSLVWLWELEIFCRAAEKT
jgi:hypothetical protein